MALLNDEYEREKVKTILSDIVVEQEYKYNEDENLCDYIGYEKSMEMCRFIDYCKDTKKRFSLYQLFVLIDGYNTDINMKKTA